MYRYTYINHIRMYVYTSNIYASALLLYACCLLHVHTYSSTTCMYAYQQCTYDILLYIYIYVHAAHRQENNNNSSSSVPKYIECSDVYTSLPLTKCLLSVVHVQQYTHMYEYHKYTNMQMPLIISRRTTDSSSSSLCTLHFL